jgi:2-phospho-L-lactate guanylyltransferase
MVQQPTPVAWWPAAPAREWNDEGVTGRVEVGRVPPVDLVVPVKSLARAKTRLRGAADDGIGDPMAHARLSLALAMDTIAAARSARGVHDVIAITSDPEVASALRADGVRVLADHPERGLNAALTFGAEVLLAQDPARPVGALQADLPALRSEELADALAHARIAMAAGSVPRAFCSDAQGSGTTLLVCAPGVPLAPRFGVGSAEAHERAGALRLRGDWPGLRQDVDTAADLRRAAELGLGPATLAALRSTAKQLP